MTQEYYIISFSIKAKGKKTIANHFEPPLSFGTESEMHRYEKYLQRLFNCNKESERVMYFETKRK